MGKPLVSSRPPRNYGAMDDRGQDPPPAMEMAELASTRGPENGEGAEVAEMKIADLNQSRLLTVYQIVVVLATMLITYVLAGELGWLVRDATHSSLRGPPYETNTIRSLHDGFATSKGGISTIPDMVFFQFPGDVDPAWFGGVEGKWVWTHGILYSVIAPAALHAVSGGILDPQYHTVVLKAPKPGSVCLQEGGDRKACCLELMEGQVDLDKSIPSDGYFGFVTKGSTELWELKMTEGLTTGMNLRARDVYALCGPIVGLSLTIIMTSMILATVITMMFSKYVKKAQRSYLRKYIAQGMFMHEEDEQAMYDKISAEVMEEEEKEHAAGQCEAHLEDEYESDATTNELEIGDAHESKKAGHQQRRLELRLIAEIGKGQGTLHFISNSINGTSTRAPVALASAAITAVGPSLGEQMCQRTNNTLAHIVFMGISCLPEALQYLCFRQGLVKFGNVGLDSGFFPQGAVATVLRVSFAVSFVVFELLNLSLIGHYPVSYTHLTLPTKRIV
eukprot:TRINITY_DN25098_c0_g2_i1.p1 TRINITY_DN25098_c0_g2~~TRINITY_DN25098_c0_g2_i1.p1  ORF type:complete len:505 (-),score=148.28 TRINITY_DN25098_c0_g2_i1:137-1651(-)